LNVDCVTSAWLHAKLRTTKRRRKKQLNALKDPEPTLAATVQVAVQNPLQAMASSSSSSSSATAPQAAPANPPVGGGKRGKQKSKKKKVSFA
jgi:mevalonate pyrophosphate decarboxylase